MRLFTSLALLFALVLNAPLWGQEIEAAPPPPPPSEEIFVVVEEMPRFPGCEPLADRAKRQQCAQEALLKYIYENVRYPEAAKAAGQEGTAVVAFIVREDGTLDNIKALRDPGAGIGEAAAAVVRKMNEDGLRWIPGKQRGIAVPVRFNLPIRFRIPEEEKVEAPEPKEEILEEEVLEEEPVFVDQSLRQEVEMAPPPPPPVIEEDAVEMAPPPPAPSRVQEVFKVVEEMPRFNNDDCEGRSSKQMKEICAQEMLLRFVSENVKYPSAAKEAGTTGICVVSFVVEMDGSLSNARLIRDIGDGCGQEVLRIVDLMSAPGQWVSGKQRGRPVRVEFTMPVRFK